MTLARLLFIFLLLFSSCNNSEVKELTKEIQGKVIAVKDGDTIEILFNGKPLKIRLAHIDCPETKKKQPFGNAAKQFTSNMCFGQVVTVISEKKFDRYNRLIAVIINDKGQNVNKELVKAGLAWHFKRYSSDKDYSELEKIARQTHVGLWAEQNPTPPWEWRNPKLSKEKTNAQHGAWQYGGATDKSSSFCSLLGFSSSRRITPSNRINNELLIINLAGVTA